MHDMEKMRKLADRYFAGKITPEEEQTLFCFLMENSENEKMFDRWKKSWNAMPTKDLITDIGWQRLKNRIHFQTSRNQSKIHWGWQIAAAIALVCSAVFISWQYNQRLISHMKESYTVSTHAGDHSSVQLPDGTQIRLNEASSLTYSMNFHQANRSVNLMGSAYFEVAADEKHPFEVKLGNCSITVKGTKFNVSAYPDNSNVTATLLEGSIDFTTPQGITHLQPGKSLSYDKDTETTVITQIDIAKYQAWIDGRVEFVNVTIRELCEEIQDLYGVTIILNDVLMSDQTSITIRLNNQESLDSVLAALDLIIPISVDWNGSDIYISAE